jgi:predicted nucleic acid-binding protein
MNDNIFVDSNIWLYLFDADQHKKNTVLRLLSENHTISTQVLSENANVCLKKLRMTEVLVSQHIQHLTAACHVVLLKPSTIKMALQIKQNHQLSFYDSQILAAAIENQCNILLSEDLAEGATYEGKVKVINPFR